MFNRSQNTERLQSPKSQKRARVPHIEPLFEDAAFVADYSRITKRYSAADYRPILEHVISSLQSVEQPKVLELGPGPGWCGISLAKHRSDLKLIGLDLSQTYVDIANQNAADEGVEKHVIFQVGNACILEEFSNQSFDAVISNQSFHYWDLPLVALNEIARILKPGGAFCIGADRRDLSFLSKIGVSLAKWLLTAEVRESWMRSFQGSFTVQEVNEMIDQSSLRDCASIEIHGRMYFIQGQLSSQDPFSPSGSQRVSGGP